MAGIRSVGQDLAERIVAERDTAGPYPSIGQLTERVQLDRPAVEALATAGVTGLGPDRRAAL
ncbi:hypothetical protein ACQPXB_22260 [Amycolatopsis sp. CA-161197]|uniref:helix-hairpin-helix domain-containing protein n=1 Tax=unclassified Amycolatopsis TaxID=2618356 RepID=UPI00369B557B